MTFKNSSGVYPCVVDYTTNDHYLCGGGTQGGSEPEEPVVLPYDLNKVQRVFQPSPSPDEFSQFGHSVTTSGAFMAVGTKYSEINEDGTITGTTGDNGFIDIYKFVDYRWVHIQNIPNPDPVNLTLNPSGTDNYFGNIVKMNDTYLVVGAQNDSPNDASPSDVGSIYIFKRNGDLFEFDDKFFNPTALAGGNFGLGVDVDPTTHTIAVLAEDGLSIYDVNAGTWSLTQNIPVDAIGLFGAESYQWDQVFGDDDVFIRGNKIYAGRQLAKKSGTTTGVVDVYELSGTWSHVGFLDNAPSRTIGALTGNTDFLFVTVDDDGFGAGLPKIQVYDATDTLVQTITAPNPSFAITDFFATVIESNDTYLIVGCPYSDDNGLGLAIVYEYDGVDWVVLEYLRNNDSTDLEFGSSLSVSDDHYLIGSNYSYIGSTTNKLTRIGSVQPFATHELVDAPVLNDLYENIGPAEPVLTPIQNEEGFNCFEGVAINGTTLFAGTSYYQPVGGSYTPGAIFVYEYNGNNTVYSEQLDCPNTQDNGAFGTTISTDGEWMVTSDYYAETDGPTESGGLVYVYRKVGSNWVLFQTIESSVTPKDLYEFGYHVSINDGVIAISAPNASPFGYVELWRFDNTSFVFEQRIEDTQYQVGFGHSLSICQDWLIIGVPNRAISHPQDGEALIYHYDGSSWVLQHTVLDLRVSTGDTLGHTVAITDKYAVISAIYEDESGQTDSGAARVLRRDNDVWSLIDYVFPDPAKTDGEFGFACEIFEDYIIIAEGAATLPDGSLNIYRVEDDQVKFKSRQTSPLDAGGGYGGYYTDSIAISDQFIAVVEPNGTFNVDGEGAVIVHASGYQPS